MTARPPYAVAPNVFPFPALAALAGRAPLGGPREIALACLVGARLASGCMEPAIGTPERTARAAAARSWLGSLNLPPGIRNAVTRVADASAGESPAAVAAALVKVMEVTAGQVDGHARLELQRLTASLDA